MHMKVLRLMIAYTLGSIHSSLLTLINLVGSICVPTLFSRPVINAVRSIHVTSLKVQLHVRYMQTGNQELTCMHMQGESGKFCLSRMYH